MEKTRILIVDDQRSNIDVLVGLLAKDYELSVALDGQTALRLVEEVDPRLVLLDVTMPGMDGYEVCQKIKAHPRSRFTPVIFLTGLNQDGDEARGLSLGAVDYIAKPFNLVLVKSRIDNHMAVAKAWQHLVRTEKQAVLGNLVAGMAHELNTPIGNVLTAASFLQEQILEFQELTAKCEADDEDLMSLLANIRQTADIIQRGIERAARLTTSFRQVSAQQYETPGRFKVKELIGQVQLSLNSLLSEKNCLVTVEDPSELELDGIAEVFVQIFTHLMLNSLRYAWPDTDQGRIGIHLSPPEQGMVEIIYADDGNGCSPQELAHLFEPFYASLHAHNGTGLGTFTIYNLVTQKLGGTVEASSPEETGLRYSIKFPLEVS